MNQQTALATHTETHATIELVTNSLTSEHSKRAYAKALTDFFKWREENDNPPLTKATIQQYKHTLTGSTASIILKMSAIRKLAQEASDFVFPFLHSRLPFLIKRFYGRKPAYGIEYLAT